MSRASVSVEGGEGQSDLEMCLLVTERSAVGLLGLALEGKDRCGLL